MCNSRSIHCSASMRFLKVCSIISFIRSILRICNLVLLDILITLSLHLHGYQMRAFKQIFARARDRVSCVAILDVMRQCLFRALSHESKYSCMIFEITLARAVFPRIELLVPQHLAQELLV